MVAEDVPITDDVSILLATKPGQEGGGDDEYGEGEQVNGMTIPDLEGNKLAFMPFRHRISRHTHGTLLFKRQAFGVVDSCHRYHCPILWCSSVADALRSRPKVRVADTSDGCRR